MSVDHPAVNWEEYYDVHVLNSYGTIGNLYQPVHD